MNGSERREREQNWIPSNLSSSLLFGQMKTGGERTKKKHKTKLFFNGLLLLRIVINRLWVNQTAKVLMVNEPGQ